MEFAYFPVSTIISVLARTARISIVDLEGLHAVSCDGSDRIERRYEELPGPLD